MKTLKLQNYTKSCKIEFTYEVKKFKDNEMSGLTVLCLVLHAADMTHCYKFVRRILVNIRIHTAMVACGLDLSILPFVVI